ncbi:MAG: oligosaccharide flippase family protein [Lachnospiraceae bacterium]
MIDNIRQKYNNIPLRIRASMWFFICSLMQKAVSVVSTAVFTRLMSTEDYGLISIYNSWSDIFMIVASLNLAVGCFNVGMTRFEGDQKHWVSSLQILSVISASIFTFFFLGSYNLWCGYIGLPFETILVMGVTFFTIPALNLWTANQRFQCSYQKLIAVSMLYSVGVFISSLISVVCFDNKGIAKIYATAGITIVVGGVLLISNLKAERPVINRGYVKFATKYNLQMMPAFLATVLLNQIDRVMIDHMVGRSSVAIYSVAYNAAYMISIVSSAINATYNPWLMKRVKNDNYENTNKIGITITAFLLIVIFGFIFCAPEFVKIIASEEYYEAIYIIPAVAASTFFSLIYTLYCPIAQYYLKAKELAFVTVVSAILNVLLNYVAINKYGYIAAGYTTYICYLIYGWGTGIYCIYLLKKNGIKAEIYDGKKLVMLTIILSVATIMAPFLYDGYWVRYLLLVCIILFLAFSGKRYFKLFSDIRKG